MAGACTYASLRFAKTPPKTTGTYPEGSSTVCVEDGQLMYENIKTTRGAAEITYREEERRLETQVHMVQTFWKNHNVHILMVMCLILLASFIGIGSQFFQMYKNHQIQISDLTKMMEMMNWTIQKEQQSCQEAHLASNLSATQMINNCISSLHISREIQEQSKLELENAAEKGEQMETKLKKTEKKLNEVESSLNKAKQLLDDYEDTECCEKGWTLLAGVCLYFCQEKMLISESEKHCLSKQAWLIGTRIQDPAVKAFMKAGQMEEEYWTGMRTNYWSENIKWVDNRSLGKHLYNNNICGIINRGELKAVLCNEWNYFTAYKSICEKNPLKIKLKNGMPV
ncbi:B-cell differentiation antigen CD72-like isoform X1 [Pleurodeles waltl]|uniref:B-cell differentiation antigen CD72-like isoform X1 n=1 Tax=Pleurodeles waltl TaxID=8319 RepID=UPI003709951C